MPVSVLLITSVLYLLSLARCISFPLILLYYHTLVPKSLVNETERSGNEIITIKTTERVVHIVVHYYAIVCCFQSLDGHHGAITCVKFDDYHIITGSLDCYAMAWSSIGNHKKCLQAFRHPKYVILTFSVLTSIL